MIGKPRASHLRVSITYGADIGNCIAQLYDLSNMIAVRVNERCQIRGSISCAVKPEGQQRYLAERAAYAKLNGTPLGPDGSDNANTLEAGTT